jgi:hypothetical protein
LSWEGRPYLQTLGQPTQSESLCTVSLALFSPLRTGVSFLPLIENKYRCGGGDGINILAYTQLQARKRPFHLITMTGPAASAPEYVPSSTDTGVGAGAGPGSIGDLRVGVRSQVAESEASRRESSTRACSRIGRLRFRCPVRSCGLPASRRWLWRYQLLGCRKARDELLAWIRTEGKDLSTLADESTRALRCL